MPAFDKSQLQAHIAMGRIGAVSLDTSIFDQYQNNLASPALLGLRQFRGTATQFVLSEVVLGEVKSHIAARAAEAKIKLDTALKGIKKAWRNDIDSAAVAHLLGTGRTPQALADQAASEFSINVAYEFICADGLVTHAEVLRRYFDAIAPFSRSEAKKNEFPDALALLSLEAWAAQNNTIMLLVSRDGDWKSFADASDHLICVNDLATALDYFNSESRFVAERAVGLLRNSEAPNFHSAVETALEAFLETFDPDIQAWSTMEYDVETLDCALQWWEIDGDSEVKVLNADEEGILFSMMVRAIVNFSGTFEFSVRDSFDRDYVSMGSNTMDRDETIKISLVIWIGRQFDHEPDVHEIEITPPRVSIDFGNIDPKWGDDE
jgi:hypothetical protein